MSNGRHAIGFTYLSQEDLLQAGVSRFSGLLVVLGVNRALLWCAEWVRSGVCGWDQAAGMPRLRSG